jgi:hypothetical protein
MDFKRKLIWHPMGYQPEGYEWHNYYISTNPIGISHDLYHHRVGESGTWTEEFRAFGASARFQAYEFNMIGDNGVAFAQQFSSELNREPIIPEYYNSKPCYNEKIEHFAFYLMCCNHHGTYLRNILMDGYNHALQFTEEAYQRVKDYNFWKAWKRGNQLEVDLSTGFILDLEPSRLFQSASIEVEENGEVTLYKESEIFQKSV